MHVVKRMVGYVFVDIWSFGGERQPPPQNTKTIFVVVVVAVAKGVSCMEKNVHYIFGPLHV